MRLIHTMDLGLNKDHVVNIRLNRLITDRIPVLKNTFSKIPSVVYVSANGYAPNDVNWNQSVWWQGQDEELRTNMWIIGIDRDFMKTMEIPMIEGEDLIKTFQSSGERAYILNRSALEYMGWESAVGKKFSIFGEEAPGRVIGVTEEFLFRSLHHEVAPCVMLVRDQWRQLSVRIRPTRIDATLGTLKDTWKEIVPQFPFTYSFLDETFDSLYRSERKLNQLIIVFTILSLLIACLGLFSLSSLSAEQKTKEIGIRKVMGASVSNIIHVISMQFIRWVLLANLFAWPVAYYTLRLWLRNFAYRIDIILDAFLLSGVLALLIALLIVSVRSIKAALANPVDSLKYE